jgi:RNA polymerase sigma-70 factor (ECF subfamily)
MVTSGDRPWAEEGREALFTRVATEAAPALYQTALALLGDAAEAEDAVQEAFLRGFRALQGFRGDADLRTWLYRITVNLCRDAGRRKSARQRLLLRLAGRGPEEPDPGPAPDEAVEQAAEGRELRRLLAALDARHREPVVLKHVAGRSVNEIAAALKIPEGTVKRRLHEAYRKLRAELAKGGEQGER